VAGTDGPVYVLASGPGAVFFLIAPQTSRSPLVARYDVHTHDMATGPRIQGAADLAYAGGSLWVSAGVQSSAKQPAGTKLYRLNPSTLQIADTFSMPKPVMPLLPTPAGLWSGSDGDLYLVDPASGAIKRTVAVTGSVGQLAWEKTNHLLYDSTHRSGFADAFAVEERSAASGALVVRSTRLRNVPSINSLASTPDGVWVSYATGMMGTSELDQRSDLQRAGAPIEGGNGMLTSIADGILWIAPYRGLQCADPATGQVRSDVPKVAGFWTSEVVAVGSNVFAGGFRGLVKIHPGPNCTG